MRFWIERVVARQHGGDDRFMNLALSCPWRNRYKGTNLSAIDPESQLIVPLFHPRTQDWDEHFFLDGFVIAGLTPTGRATAELLAVNDRRRLYLRRLAGLVEGGPQS